MNYEEIISPMVVEADQLIKNAFLSLSPLYKEGFPSYQDVTVPLFTVLHSTSESILILLLNGALFEADILLRSLMEGTVKYCYLMSTDSEVREKRYQEYKNDLSEIDKLLDHRKALEAVEILHAFNSNSTKPFELSILNDDIVESLEQLYPNRKRNEIKQKWTYGHMLNELAKENAEYEAQLASISSYSLMSHFCHFDWTGVSMRNEQITTAARGDETLDVAHGMRIISNVMTFYLFRTSEYIRCNQYSSESILRTTMDIYKFVEDINIRQNNIVEKEIK